MCRDNNWHCHWHDCFRNFMLLFWMGVCLLRLRWELFMQLSNCFSVHSLSARQQCVYWRPLAKKSTANQRYAISYWWLIVADLLTVCEIFSCVEVENRHFRPLHSDCRPLEEERPTIGPNSVNFCIKHKWLGSDTFDIYLCSPFGQQVIWHSQAIEYK